MRIFKNWYLPLFSAVVFTMCEEIPYEDTVRLKKDTIASEAEFSEADSKEEWYFDTNGNFEGWTMLHEVHGEISENTLNLTCSGKDPHIKSPSDLGITSPATYKYIYIGMKNNSSKTAGKIYFITNTDEKWNEKKSKSFIIKANTNYFADYMIDMSTVADWNGTIKQIRIDPLDPGESGLTVTIDFIRVTDNNMLRGTMSMSGAATRSSINTLGGVWNANLIRWQINSSPLPPTDMPGYTNWLNQELLDLDNTMNYCHANGIKVIIDMHAPPGGSNSTQGTLVFYNQTYNDKLVEVWKTIANRYKNHPALYGYDLINEPVQKTTPLTGCDFKTTQTRIGNAIRVIDPKTTIFIAVDNWDNPDRFTDFTPVPLTNVIYQVHMYLPHKFTHQGVGNNSETFSYPGTINGSYYDKERLTSLLDPVLAFQKKYSTRIYVGEFSAIRWAPGASTYLGDCIDIFEGYGWMWSYHAYREWAGWSLEFENQKTPEKIATAPTDRYNTVVGYGLGKNK